MLANLFKRQGQEAFFHPGDRMPTNPSTIAWQRAVIILSGTLVGVVIVVCLYLAKAICIPVALAIFLAFVFWRPVTKLQDWGLGRIWAVLTVVLLAGLLLIGIGWVVGTEVNSLLVEMPKYSENIENKIHTVQDWVQDNRLGQLLQKFGGTWKGQEAPAEDSNDAATRAVAVPATPTPVILEPGTPTWLAQLPLILGYLLEGFARAGLAVVLTVFILLRREDLRNRFIRLVGHGRMTVTTKAVDDASQRISRYLYAQLLINSCFGFLVAAGLYLIGVEYAFLWGFLAGLLRYVPYIGSPIACLFPIALSVMQFQGWLHPLLVVGLILGLEFIANNVMEPRFYGQSIGVSEAGMLVAAAFWAFLWGPIGLVLSGPMTVCLVILGKYVPPLEFFDVLLGDERALEPRVTFYQRLTAMDQDEAGDVVQSYAKTHSSEEVYDHLLIPALTHLRRDRELQLLSEEDEKSIVQSVREIIEDLEEQQVAVEKFNGEIPEHSEIPAQVSLLGIPARNESDWLGLKMLQNLLDLARWRMEVVGCDWLSSEVIELVEKKQPQVICIASMPPGGLARARYLCKRLRSRFPQLRIVVGRWGLMRDQEENRQRILKAGADQVNLNLLETRNHLNAWSPVLAETESAQQKDQVSVQHGAG
jgi:predicted PurR-regulated permease PerM